MQREEGEKNDMDFETAVEMQRICTGEKRELTRGQIAGEIIDIHHVTEHFNQERADRCMRFYQELSSDETKKLYDAASLVEETEAIKAQFHAFLESTAGDDMCGALFDKISDFFMAPPFEGLDGVEYGINEVCVFSLLEYFMWKVAGGYDHHQCRIDYRNSIAERTQEEVADHWMGVYDDLQARYETIGRDFTGEHAMQEKLAGCCIIAISAIRDQDAFTLDMVQSGAEGKGSAIAQSYLAGTYAEGESTLADNVIKLFEFVRENIG